MHLVSFGVRNYRSITAASKLPLQPSATVLIGPNNEGKSNLVSALAVAMTALRNFGTMRLRAGNPRILFRPRDTIRYRWRQDFPVALQSHQSPGEAQFDLEFQLTESEILEFWNEVKSSVNGTLPIRLILTDASFKFSIPKKGRGARALTQKADAIARFVGTRIDFRHIRAIRTATEARSVVEGLIRRELSVLEADPQYQAAVQEIAALQAPILSVLSTNIRDTLKAFLPSVSSVSIAIPQQERYDALAEYWEIFVNDGVATRLEQKGDGVQSLAALSLMRSASQASAGSRQLILAIEEPESHLHPRAIHQLRKVIAEIATQHQTILTTHCPLFVDRAHPGSNIIVVNNRARPATSTQEIRDVMGVRVADNLIHAELVLIVEGLTDQQILQAWLASESTIVAAALKDHYLVIDPLVGASRLVHRLLAARDAMCAIYCFLDNDPAGLEAIKAAQRDGLLTSNDYTLAMRPGLKYSELEDLIDSSVYNPHVLTTYGIDLTSSTSKDRKLKWSDRLEAAFLASGKPWDDHTIISLKSFISREVQASPGSAVPEPFRSTLDALIQALVTRVEANKQH